MSADHQGRISEVDVLTIAAKLLGVYAVYMAIYLLYAYYAFLGAWLVSWLRWEPTRLKLPEEIVGGVVLEVAAAIALIRWARPIAAILGTEDSEADAGSSWTYLRIERAALSS